MNKLTKFSRAILAIAMTLMVALPTLAHDFEVDGIYYNYLDNTAKLVEVTYKGSSYSYYYNEYTGSVIIPSSVTYSGTTYSVTSIGDYAFCSCSGLTSITIPNSVTEIGYYAFSRCTGLTSIVVEEGNPKYDSRDNCNAIIETSTNTLILGCKNSTIANSVTGIGDDAFLGCSGLTSVTIPNSVTSIGASAFSSCSGLTSITIPNSVTEIGSHAFSSCSGLTEVNISDLSAWCKIDFGSSGANPLYYAMKLKLNGIEIKDLVIPNDITEIKDYAFYRCTGLTSVTIGNSVTTIGDKAFYECTGLTLVTIPNSVTSIGSSAFYGTTWYNNLADGVIYINNVLYKYKGSMPNGTSISVKDGTVSISPSAFYGCTGLTSITIPNSVTTIGNSAFEDCTGLTSVTIGNSVTSIGGYAFFSCDGLTSVTIPNSVTDIGEWAFYGCKGLTSITIPNSVASIGDKTFYGCSGLTSITIPNSVTSIGDEAFRSCSGLTSVTIGNSVTEIGDEAFYNCWDLRTIISLNPTPPVCANSNSFYNYSSATLYVPKDSYAKYFVDDVWGQFTNIKKIEILVSSITLNNPSIELDKGSTASLTATIAPSNATIKNIVWTSSNPQIATVDQLGKVTTLSAGTATITAIANDGSNVSAYCKVVVKGVETKITLSQTEANLPVNDIMTLSYEVIPLTTPIEWSTSNENVAYIKKNADNSVTVVGMAGGVAIITAKALDGSGVSASCVVTVGVSSGVEGVEVDSNAIEIARYDIHGRLLSEPTKGINIVKYNDGTTRKEFVKNLYY